MENWPTFAEDSVYPRSHAPPVNDVAIRRIRSHEWQQFKDIRLRALADAPDAFGSTLAEALIATIVSWARDRGAKQMSLWVTETNDSAGNLYRRRGFVATGERAPVREGSELVAARMVRSM